MGCTLFQLVIDDGSSCRYMQKLSEATQQKLADANAVAEAHASGLEFGMVICSLMK